MDNLQQNICINKGRPVYFSYARSSSRQPGWEHLSDCVDKILETFRQRNIEYRVDVRDIGAGDSISDFEREIGWNSEVVVLVFSDKYFRSLHCMYEFVQIKNALKKHPEKQLICIKSGDVDVSNVNYIMEVEHYWGDIKQEYETIEFHKLRNHSGTEQAAFENGFYLNEIRSLKDFFGNRNCYNADIPGWNGLADQIYDYYAHSKKSFLQRFYERKSKISKMKSLGIGLSVLIILVILFNIIDPFMITEYTVEYPEYRENIYFQDDEVYTNISKITTDKDYTTLYFHSVNLTDDTLHKIHIDTSNTYLYFNPEWTVDTFPLLEFKVLGDYNSIPTYYPGGKGSFIDYKMVFKMVTSLPSEPFNFISGNSRGVFHLLVRENELSFENVAWWRRDPNPACLSIVHPLFSKGISNCFVTKIETQTAHGLIIDPKTVILLHYLNTHNYDDTISIPRDCHIVANGKKYTVSGLNGLQFSPFVTKIPRKSSLDFALFFPQIDYNTDSIDLVINDSFIISGIKLKKKPIANVDNPEVSNSLLGSISISKVELYDNQTVLHFRYNNRFKKSFVEVCANSNSYIVVDGQKYPLQNVSCISLDPIKTMIPANSSLDYALYFPPIPPDTKTLDFINQEYSRKELGEQKYNEILDMFGDEYANESGDKISTGIFGIRIQ